MPFIRRDPEGQIVAVSELATEGMLEEIAGDDPALASFLRRVRSGESALEASDQGFIRVLEDVIDLLIDKGVIAMRDLPQDARDKIELRRRLRRQMQGAPDSG